MYDHLLSLYRVKRVRAPHLTVTGHRGGAPHNKVRTLRRKLATTVTKSKRKQPVNPNKLFVDLNDTQEGSNRASQATLQATATPAVSMTSRLLPLATVTLRDAMNNGIPALDLI